MENKIVTMKWKVSSNYSLFFLIICQHSFYTEENGTNFVVLFCEQWNKVHKGATKMKHKIMEEFLTTNGTSFIFCIFLWFLHKNIFLVIAVSCLLCCMFFFFKLLNVFGKIFINWYWKLKDSRLKINGKGKH